MAEGFALFKITGDNEDINILHANRAFNLLCGLDPEYDPVGMSWLQLFPGARRDMLAKFIDVSRTAVTLDYESFSTQLKKWYHGKVYSPKEGYIAIIFADITERKEEHELVLKQKAELEKAAKEKDKVFSMLVHDLRSPFHGLINLTSICREDFDDLSREEMKRMSGTISRTISGVYSHINELLEWIMLKRGVMEFRRTWIDLFYAAQNVAEALSGSIDGKRIKFKIDGAPGMNVNGDHKNIESIFANLISNAIKFTPKGGSINVSFEEKEETIVTAISDSGIGIPADVGESLFDQDNSLKRRGTEGEASSGLGLILCKELLSLNDGTIWFESAAGKGTTFYFSLPK